MTIRRTPAKPKVKSQKRESTSEAVCSGCGRAVKPGSTPFEMPSMMLPTEYACSKGCYDVWCVEHPPPKPIR